MQSPISKELFHQIQSWSIVKFAWGGAAALCHNKQFAVFANFFPQSFEYNVLVGCYKVSMKMQRAIKETQCEHTFSIAGQRGELLSLLKWPRIKLLAISLIWQNHLNLRFIGHHHKEWLPFSTFFWVLPTHGISLYAAGYGEERDQWTWIIIVCNSLRGFARKEEKNTAKTKPFFYLDCA